MSGKCLPGSVRELLQKGKLFSANVSRYLEKETRMGGPESDRVRIDLPAISEFFKGDTLFSRA
jgi:hypothetical protein